MASGGTVKATVVGGTVVGGSVVTGIVVVGMVLGAVVCRGSELVVLLRGLVASDPSSESVRDVDSEAVESIWASSPRVDPEIPNSKSITLRPTKATPSQGNFLVQRPPF